MRRLRRLSWRARAQRRGSAALLVLLVLSLLTIVGFAMGDLCVVHLNLSHRYLSAARAQLLAQAAVQQFTVTFDKASAKLRERGLNLDRQEGMTLGLDAIYASGAGLPDPGFDDMQGKVTLTFDAQEDWSSTDNSLNEYPRAGWLDRGTAAKSVPPFTVELLVTVNVDGQVHHYRALVTRRWPYAVFTARGSIVLCGSPDQDGAVREPSLVEGPVGTLGGGLTYGWKSATTDVSKTDATQGETASPVGRPSLPQPEEPPEVGASILRLNALEPRCEVLVERFVCVGPPMRFVEGRRMPSTVPSMIDSSLFLDFARNNGLPEIEVQRYHLPPEARSGTPGQPRPVPSDSPPMITVEETQNALSGDVNVPASFFSLLTGTLTQENAIQVYPGNTHSGRVTVGFPDGLDEQHNPADDAIIPSAEDWTPLQVPPLPEKLQQAFGFANGTAGEGEASFGFLCGTLSIDPDQAVVPPLQLGGHSKWVFTGSLGNRCVSTLWRQTQRTSGPKDPRESQSEPPEWFQVLQTSGGLRLRNTVLFVNGNLDLSADVSGKHTVGIEGSNSTLIVNGTLALSGGRLDSRDQGLVILANDIVMRAHGDYRGLIIAKNSLTILSDVASANGDAANKTLTIRGGIICGNQREGSIILRSVRVVYDPVYMKAVHAYGDAICSAWKEIR